MRKIIRRAAAVLLCAALLLTGTASAAAQTDPVEERLAAMSLREKVGQLFFVRCPETNAVEDISTYHLGGYLLFSRDFKDGDNWLTKEQFLEKIQSYQDVAEIPLFIGSDEEGGTVTRASRNPNLFSAPLSSPQALYASLGFAQIGLRKNYYQHPKEDARILRKELK